MVGQRIGYERGQAAEKPLFIGIDRQAALCGNPLPAHGAGDVVAVADIIAVEVETGFAAVSFPIGDKRADLLSHRITSRLSIISCPLTRLGISFSISRSAIGGMEVPAESPRAALPDRAHTAGR